MKDVLKLKCDRTEWLKSHTLSDKERKELIEDKVKKVYNQIKFNQKIKETFSD
jgi:hypothetical protein